jgi:hypothetical protein
MHFVDALSESVRESFFRTTFCTSSYPKTSAKLARDVDLLEFVFIRGTHEPTLEDVKFAHGILGQDFEPSWDHINVVIMNDAVDILNYLVAALDIGLDDLQLRIAMRVGAIQCLTIIHVEFEFDMSADIHDVDIRETAKEGHVECLRYAIENGAQCDARALLANPDIQHDAVVQYLRTLLANSDGNAPGGTDPVDALRRAQSALDDVSDRIPEGTYLQMSNALGEVHRCVRPRRGDD